MSLKASVPTITALFAIEGKIPLFRREGKDGSRWWDLPGGKPDSAEESFEDVAVREAGEELGVAVTVGSIISRMQHPHKPDAQKIFMACAYVGGKPANKLPDEHIAMELVEPAEAVERLGNRIDGKVRAYLLSLSPPGN